MHIANEIIYELDANNHGIEENFHAITDPNWVQILNHFKGTSREARIINLINNRLTDQFPTAFTNVNVTLQRALRLVGLFYLYI